MSGRPIAAVVVRWRGGKEVEACLQSLLDHGGSGLDDVVLVDSGSADGGVERLAAKFPSITSVALDDNLSFAYAVNRGASCCADHDLLILNPDTQITPGAIPHLVAHLRHHPNISGVVPMLVDPDGSTQHLWQLRKLPTVSRLALGLPGPSQFSGSSAPDQPTGVDQPAASAWLVRRHVWDALGGLDPIFAPAWWEDVDFCARLADSFGTKGSAVSSGFQVVPEAKVIHVGASSLEHLSAERFLTIYYRNLLRYAARHHRVHVGLIRAGLALSLRVRAVVRPADRRAYLETLRALRGNLEDDATGTDQVARS